jgi:uncharacterized protein YjbI with pentapeptide repeats
MSDVDETCEYVLDPDDPDTWGGEEGDECYVDEDVLNEDGVWTCPHDAEEEEDLCIFHLPPNNKPDNINYGNRIEDLVENADTDIRKNRTQFIGSYFTDLDISGSVIHNTSDSNINMKHTQFFGDADFSDSELHGFVFSGAKFHGDANFKNSCLYGAKVPRISSKFGEKDNRIFIQFYDVSFYKGADFTNVEFQSETVFDKSQFFEYSRFGGCAFYSSVSFKKNVFEGKSHFAGVYFEKDVHFGSIFNEYAAFHGSIFNQYTEFTGTKFNSGTDFERTTFNEQVDFGLVTFREEVSFNEAEFSGHAQFGETEFKSDIDFSEAEFISGAILKELDLSGGDFRYSTLNNCNLQSVDFTDANLSNAEINGSNMERALLNRTDLFDSQLNGCAFYGAIFGNSQINEGTDFGNRCVYDPKYDSEFDLSSINRLETMEQVSEMGRLTKAAGQYRIIEKLARENAFPDMVSHNFIRRQEIHREQHRQGGRWGRWLRATASKYVLEYGENPWRLIATGLITVVGFGLLYPLVGGLQPTNGSTITLSRTINNPILLLQSIYYSTLTFTTLGMGDFLPVGLGRVLTTIETSLGAIIIALLVFVFGRRAAR